MSKSAIADVLRADPDLEDALGLCIGSLRQMAEYELADCVNKRMQDLGERKDFLDAEEHAELLSLVEFSERRTREKLDAQLAVNRLSVLLPELVQR